MKRLTKTVCSLSAFLYILPASVHACGVCMGQSDGSQVGGAINGAIFVMLGFLGMMLAGIGGVAFAIWRRSKTPVPPHLEFAELFGTQSTSK